MTDTKATLAEEGLRAERDDPFANAAPRPWFVYPTTARFPGIDAADHTSVAVFGRQEGSEAGIRGVTQASADANAALIVAAVNAYHPTPPVVEMSDLERARKVLGRGLPAQMTPLLMNIADEFAAIRREASASPTELEKELTATLRECLSAIACLGGLADEFAAIDTACAILAKATERGL